MMDTSEQFLRCVLENEEKITEKFFCGDLFAGRLADGTIIKITISLPTYSRVKKMKMTLQRAGCLIDRQEFDLRVFGASGIVGIEGHDRRSVLKTLDPTVIRDLILRYIDLFVKGGEASERI